MLTVSRPTYAPSLLENNFVPAQAQRHRAVRETSVQNGLFDYWIESIRAGRQLPRGLKAHLYWKDRDELCGAEIVQFVGDFWKRNIPRRRSLAPAVSSSGRASALRYVSTRARAKARS